MFIVASVIPTSPNLAQIHLDEAQEHESTQLGDRLQHELDILTAYQVSIHRHDHPDSVDFLADLTTFINVTVSTVLIILLQSKSRMAADSQRTRERRELEVSDAARQPKTPS